MYYSIDSNASSSTKTSSTSSFTFLYLIIPVPAGINLPIITFSFRPTKGSIFPFIAASVRTLVVSWNDAADKKLSVAKAALVIPSNACSPLASSPPNSSYSCIFFFEVKHIYHSSW